MRFPLSVSEFRAIETPDGRRKDGAVPHLVYDVHETPLGDAVLVASERGLVRLAIRAGTAGDRRASTPADLASMGARHDPDALAAATTELRAYFDGTLRTFTVAIDWSFATRFARDVLHAVTTIGYGETASYGEVAILAGRPRARRAVGSICARTPMSIILPAHRVVRADGTPGEYGAHPERKRFLLAWEARSLRADR